MTYQREEALTEIAYNIAATLRATARKMRDAEVKRIGPEMAEMLAGSIEEFEDKAWEKVAPLLRKHGREDECDLRIMVSERLQGIW